MTTQEMIFDYLKVQGLVPEYDEDKDIRFKYQMRNFVVSNYPDDRQFLQIMMPFIFDRLILLQASSAATRFSAVTSKMNGIMICRNCLSSG